MARRRRGRRGHKSKAIPLAIVLPTVGLAVSAWKDSGGAISGMGSVQNRLLKGATGYDMATKTFNSADAMPFWFGNIAGIVVHKVASKTINKHLRKLTFGYLVL